MKNQNKTIRYVLGLHGVQLKRLGVNLQHCNVGTFGEVVDQIVFLLRRCQNLGASNQTGCNKTRLEPSKQVLRNEERGL